jgi:hypothetical protein
MDVELASVAFAQLGERVAIAAAGSRDSGSLFGLRGVSSNRFGADRHRHDRFDGGSARQSSVIG